MSGLPRRVLAVGAHPDDVELLCAGTLAKFVTTGSEIHIAVVCRGDRGGAVPGLPAIRQEESRRAAAVLGAPLTFLGIGDAEVRETVEMRSLFIDLLRDVRPELILTHGPNDYHDDHTTTSRLIATCAWYAASVGHRSEQPVLDIPPAILYMDNIAGIGSEPTHLVDITDTIVLKRRMLACHRSQLRRSDSGLPDLEELAETLARLRGLQCGVRYAEGFRAAPHWGRRRPEPLLP